MEELSFGARIKHELYGEGIVSKVNITSYEIFFERAGKMEILKSNTDLSVVKKSDVPSQQGSININEFEKLFNFVLDKYGLLPEEIELGDKWTGGTLILKPSNKELKPKEIPIEIFFHKIVMLRDKLRVLEQSINSNEKLTNEEKINIQQYITRAYGSLTSFNVLFKNKEDYFYGAGGK